MKTFLEFNDNLKQSLAPNVNIERGEISQKKFIKDNALKYFNNLIKILHNKQNIKKVNYYTDGKINYKARDAVDNLIFTHLYNYELQLPKPYDDFYELNIGFTEDSKGYAGFFRFFSGHAQGSRNSLWIIIDDIYYNKDLFSTLNKSLDTILNNYLYRDHYITFYHEFIHYLQQNVKKYSSYLYDFTFLSASLSESEAYTVEVLTELIYVIQNYKLFDSLSDNHIGKYVLLNYFNHDKNKFINLIVPRLINRARGSAQLGGYQAQFDNFKSKVYDYILDIINYHWPTIINLWNKNFKFFKKKLVDKINS